MGITNGIVNDTTINQLAGPLSVLTAAVVNTNDVHSSESKSIYPPAPYFPFPFEGWAKELK